MKKLWQEVSESSYMQLKQLFIYCATKQKVIKDGTLKVLAFNKGMKPLRRQNQILILFHQYKLGIAASAAAVLTWIFHRAMKSPSSIILIFLFHQMLFQHLMYLHYIYPATVQNYKKLLLKSLVVMETDHVWSILRRILLSDCIQLHLPLGNKVKYRK